MEKLLNIQISRSPIITSIPNSDPGQFEAGLLVSTRSSFPSSSVASSSFSSSSSSPRSSFLFHFSPSSMFQRNPRLITSICLQSKRILVGCSKHHTKGDDLGDSGLAQKKNKAPESFLHRFRRKKAPSVTDFTAWEWCEKQKEFTLLGGKYRDTQAMKEGRARHAKLEEEVSKKVKVHEASVEGTMAVKFMNFIICANQLSLDGLTREIPVIGFVNGTWIVGVIDEIRMPVSETVRNPLLVDTKTRSKAALPAEPQKRNGRLQLMCYKYLWDTLVTDNFPKDDFFNYFGLNPQYILSKEIQEHATNLGFPAKTLEDLVMLFRSTCCTLPPAHDRLLLRYEFQEDQSLLGEDHFTYDSDWLKRQINHFLEFWLGKRDASYVPEDERWKCRYCDYASDCPSNATTTPPPAVQHRTSQNEKQ